MSGERDKQIETSIITRRSISKTWSHLVRVSRNTRDSVDTEVKRIDFEAGFLHERNYEPAQTTIYMHWNAVFSSELEIKRSGYFS